MDQQNPSIPKLRALVVDDDRFISALLEESLVALGLDVVKSRPSELFTQDLDQSIVLIIADVNLRRDPDANVITRLKYQYPGVSILAISAQFWASTESAGDLARRLNVERVLAKPFSYHAFDMTVRSLLGKYE